MNTNELYKIKDDLKKLILKVGKIVEEGYHSNEKEITTKTHKNDFLTKYDLLANSMIVNYIKEKYPDINIISEEEPKINNKSEYSFIIDPIDGTMNFVRKIPIFYSGIALAKNNKTILCLTYNPILK